MRRNITKFALSFVLLLTANLAGAGTLYMVTDDDDDTFYIVDTSNAQVTKIGQNNAHDGDAEGLAPGPVGSPFLYSVNNQEDLDEVQIDGSGYNRVGGDLDDCDRGLAYNRVTDTLYGSDNGNFCIINTSTSSTTDLPDTPGDNDTEGLAADPVNNYVYGIDNSERLLRFDVGANSWSVIGDTNNIPDGDDIGLAYDPAGNILYAVDEDGDLYSVNPSTGHATYIGDTGLYDGSLDVGLAWLAGCEIDQEPQRQGDGSRATFCAEKSYDDGNPGAVEITLSCNTGLPLEQSKTIMPGETVTFVVTDFDNEQLDCTVTEAPIFGYEPGYSANGHSNNDDDDDGCYFTSVESGDQNVCAVTNSLESVEITVHKEWVDANPDFNLPQDVYIELECDNGFYDSQWIYPNNPGVFTIYPHFDGTDCHLYEEERSGFESDTSDCYDLAIAPGHGDVCTVVNTRLYEGIPTLNQYGLAILALLMLGMGFIGFRRFV